MNSQVQQKSAGSNEAMSVYKGRSEQGRESPRFFHREKVFPFKSGGGLSKEEKEVCR